MFRHIAYGALLVGFSAVSYMGLRGWARPYEPPDTSTEAPPEPDSDELPLMTGHISDHRVLAHTLAMGYPWNDVRTELDVVKRDLPPDPAVPTAEDVDKANRNLLRDMVITMPAGRMVWPEVYAALKKAIERHGIKVTTGKPEAPATLEMTLPDREWTGFSLLAHVITASQKKVMYIPTSEGLCVGTDEACNNAVRDATLVVMKRRLAAEQADPALDVEFRPDIQDATMAAFGRAVRGQTGIDVVADIPLWDAGTIVAWRGRPRPLREAIDRVATKLRVYWRWHGGRLWLLRP